MGRGLTEREKSEIQYFQNQKKIAKKYFFLKEKKSKNKKKNVNNGKKLPATFFYSPRFQKKSNSKTPKKVNFYNAPSLPILKTPSKESLYHIAFPAMSPSPKQSPVCTGR